MSTSREHRLERIRVELAKRATVEGDDLAELLAVSRATIRRDLDELEARGILRRTHGGATADSPPIELPYYSKLDTMAKEKREIGLAVADLLPDEIAVGCTGGTTVMYAMRALKGKRGMVVTNAVNVAMELASAGDIEVVVTGGSLRPRTFELIGLFAERLLETMRLDVALLGVDGISIEHGISTYTLGEAHMAALFMERAREVWILADHTKIDTIAPALIAPLSRVNRLVTDSGIEAEHRRRFEAAGILVTTVDD